MGLYFSHFYTMVARYGVPAVLIHIRVDHSILCYAKILADH